MEPVVITRINAAFDELWEEVNAALVKIPWPVHDKAAAYVTRQNILGIATRITMRQEKDVAAMDKPK